MMMMGYEETLYSRVAAAAWSVAVAAGNNPLLIEHNSAIVGLIVLSDHIANKALGAISEFSMERPYATTKVYVEGREITVPVVGLFNAPEDETARQWYEVVQAAIWRLADLSEIQPQTIATTDPRFVADKTGAVLVRVVGESHVESLVSSSVPLNSYVKEHEESARAAAAIFTAGVSYVNVRAGGAASLTAEQTNAAQLAISALSKESKSIVNRARMRMFAGAAVIIGGSYAIGAM